MSDRCVHMTPKGGLCFGCIARRDRFAAAALTGLRSKGVDWTAADVAQLATEDADAIIAELDKRAERERA